VMVVVNYTHLCVTPLGGAHWVHMPVMGFHLVVFAIGSIKLAYRFSGLDRGMVAASRGCGVGYSFSLVVWSVGSSHGSNRT